MKTCFHDKEDNVDNTLPLAIRSAMMSASDEAALVKAIEEYGKDKWRQGYDEGIAVANSDWP